VILQRFIGGLIWTLFFVAVAFAMAGGIAAWKIRKETPHLSAEETARLAIDAIKPWIPYCLGGAIALGILGAGTGTLPGTRSPRDAFEEYGSVGPASLRSEQPSSWPTFPEPARNLPSQYAGSAGADLSRVLGIVSLFAWCVPIIGLPVSIVGIVAGVLTLNTIHRRTAINGIALNCLGFVLAVINSILGVLLYLSIKRHH
jgi:hypothetical protein